MSSEFAQFIGTAYTFDDGAKIKIIQIKLRETGYAIMYEVSYHDSLPQRLIKDEAEFIGAFGHLFVS